MISTKIGQATPISLQLVDGIANRHPVAYLKDEAGNDLASYNLVHNEDGLYLSSFTPIATGYYQITFITYLDAGHTTEDITYEIVHETYYATDPSEDSMVVADAVWDEIMTEHNIPNSFGLQFQAIRQFVELNFNALYDGTWGLEAIFGEVINQGELDRVQINQNEVKIDQIIPAVNLARDNINANIDYNQQLIEALSVQAEANKIQIIAEILANRAKLDQIIGAIGAISNNTTVRFIVPETLVKPETGTKIYQFHLRLFDDNGNPEAPDSTPTIRIRSLLSGLDIISGAPMVQDGTKVGAYYYSYSISNASLLEHLLVEATIVKSAVAKYIPATTEVVEYQADLNDIQYRLGVVDSHVLQNKSILENPTSGLAAIRTTENTIINEINQNEVKIDAIETKVSSIPSDLATKPDVTEVLNAVEALPLLSQIVTQLNYLRDAIRGPDGRTNTDVYNKIDFTDIAKTSDPRFDNLDAPISGASTLNAADVWTYAQRTLTNLTIPNSEIAKIWNYLVSQITVVGSIGKRIVDYLDVAVSTRATQAQVSALLSGVAQEASVQQVLTSVMQGIAINQVNFADILALLNAIKPKTDLIPANPATQQDVNNAAVAMTALLNNIITLNNAIKTSTNRIPLQPATEASVHAIPINPVLATDPRLANLDVPVSTRSTLNLASLANLVTKTDLTNTQNNINSSIHDAETTIINSVLTRSTITQIDNRIDSTDSRIDTSTQAILDAIANIPSGGGSSGGATAAEIWAYGTRSLTTPFPNISNLATKTDVINASSSSYTNRMGTTFRQATNDQEMIVWAEKSGIRQTATTNCSVIVKDSAGATKWSATGSAPNSDGIYRFVHPVVVSADQNYYVIISIVVDGQPRVSQQAFFTLG